MALKFDLSGTGSPPLPADRGVSATEIAPFAKTALESLAGLRDSPPGFLRTLDRVDDLAAVKEQAAALSWAHDVVILGIGGSGLGARTVQAALPAAATSPRLHVLDNVDPHTIRALEARLDLARTAFVAVSKSGSTAETIAQTLYFRDRLQKAGIEKWAHHFVFVTDPEKGALREVAHDESVATLAVPGDVGGRFSVLTAVGLLPAAVLGVEPERLIAGAGALRDRVLAPDSDEGRTVAEWVARHAALHFQRGASIQVLMSYCDRLGVFGDWFAQLWAESLGKRRSRGGEEVFRGSTPIAAVGARDQHSLVQLFAEGPADKQFLFVGLRDEAPENSEGRVPEGEVREDEAREDRAPIPAAAAELHEDFAYLGNRSLADLFEAERLGTVRGLRAASRPCAELTLDRLDAEHLGALFVLFEIATALAGDLYDVDPYDQPGVEAGKIAAFALMDRPGYAKQAQGMLGDNPAPGPERRLPPY